MNKLKLLADIGGTNARFALLNAQGASLDLRVLPCAAYPSLADAVRGYLSQSDILQTNATQITQAAIAIANPVMGDQIQMTNHHWNFSIAALQREFGWQSLSLVNDFKALALALPHLSGQQKYQVGGLTGQPGAPLGLLGAGTGLGVSGLIAAGERWVALDSEGGHASFSPCNEQELAILGYAWREYGHASCERMLSGNGLQLMYRALAQHQQIPADALDAPEILRRGLASECGLCMQVIARFCEILGTIAGNLAVTLGARGGIYIGGGIVPRLGAYFSESGFRQRFEQKGRMSAYLRPIPTYVITEPYPAFIGLSALLRQA